uniref:PX n=1 Tax=long-tailed grass lizard adenovirus 1 TaxID=1631550 RepID=A0A0H3VBK2_9ADEN|nr:pX [long-tailed grass lizard adenovirus 1]
MVRLVRLRRLTRRPRRRRRIVSSTLLVPRRRRTGNRNKRVRIGTRRMRGGFLPLLAPIIAAAIGAIPGIAGTIIAAKQSR